MKDIIIEKVKEVVEAGSCCAELRAAGQAYLAALGTDQEKIAAVALIAELEEDVNFGEQSLAFFESDAAKEMFGEDQAKAMADAQRADLDNGGKYCICPACQAGGALLEMKDEILC